MYQIETETPDDLWEVEALYDTCFAPGRELLSSYRLRDGVEKVTDLCLLARDEHGVLAAAIRYWPIRIGAGEHRALLLGPIAVHHTRQGEGLGGLLMNESMAEAVRLGWERVMLVGDAPYYSRFGFEKLDHVEMPPPTNPERVLGVALRPGAWDGVEGLVHKDD
ncbi:GNAT family N-acetyltransferase [Celeribacter sp. PS-C1]|uniref:GNAT family N-acetyltransferase n=1 Tax=Celeribacter sp. PS-C1 TaxID=2820813 RepID=UPI001C6852EA|nr:N-acetyltransferase [Celeribacter sp. PS-C1]